MVTPVTFSSTGPDGFLDPAASTPLPTAKLIEGKPVGADHGYFERYLERPSERPSARLKAGIWRSEPYTEWYEDYPCDEFMYILEGHVFVHCDECSEYYDEGSAFLLPKGFQGFWRQPVAMVKYYVTVE